VDNLWFDGGPWRVSALILYVRDVKTQVRALSGCGGPNLACSRPAFVPRRFSHYQYDRGITLREAARLHSFPDEFEFVRPRLQVARQIGNALPPVMARAFAVQIGRALGSAVVDDALSEELVVGARNRPREGRGQQLAAGVSLKGVEGSEDPADEQGVVPRGRHSRTA
jgi:hypothetical protein